MLFKTYQKITTLFKEHHGYMSFADLRDHQVTVLQLAEMEEEGSLERFARGWYWCKDCGYEKPEDYQYIEIAKVNPRAVICMDSAAWLAGMLKEEPATIAVATARTDRKKMDLENFEIRRFYFQNADVPGEICEKKTEFGSYKYYSPKRTFCDCLRMNNKMTEDLIREILPGVSACISDGYAYTISSYVPLCHSQKSHKMRSKEQYLTSRTGNVAIQ